MMGILKRLGRRIQRRWNPLRPTEGQTESDVKEERVSILFLGPWIPCVPFAIWMALGDMPSWLELAVLAILWVFSLFQLLTVGLVPLSFPFMLIWLAFPGNRKKVESWPDPQEEWEEKYEERMKWLQERKEEGDDVDGLMLPKHREEQDAWLERRFPDRPAIRWAFQLLGLVLIVALIADERLILAGLFAFPTLGWYAVNGVDWVAQHWRRARA